MRKDRSLEQRSRFSRITSPSTVNLNVLGFSTFPPSALSYAISGIISVHMAFEGYCLFPSAMSPGKSSIKSRRRPFPALVMQIRPFAFIHSSQMIWNRDESFSHPHHAHRQSTHPTLTSSQFIQCWGSCSVGDLSCRWQSLLQILLGWQLVAGLRNEETIHIFPARHYSTHFASSTIW